MGRSFLAPQDKVGRLKFDVGGFINHHSNSGGAGRVDSVHACTWIKNSVLVKKRQALAAQ